MTRRIKKPSPSPAAPAAAQPLLGGQEFSSSTSHCGAPPPPCSSCGEVVGGAAAECAAICCCCPCGLVNLFVLAVYKLPKGICRKALRRKRRRRVLKNGNDQFAPHGKGGSREYWDEFGVLRNGNDQFAPHRKGGSREYVDELGVELESVSGFSRGNSVILDEEIVALEEEMWAKFYDGGFWRSPSQSQMSEKCDIAIVSL